MSILLLINFAANNGLPLTFRDVDGWFYISKALCPFDQCGGQRVWSTWLTREMFTRTVQNYIRTKSLWNHNTIKNPKGPQPGDLMMRYRTFLGHTVLHHTALVFFPIRLEQVGLR